MSSNVIGPAPEMRVDRTGRFTLRLKRLSSSEGFPSLFLDGAPYDLLPSSAHYFNIIIDSRKEA
jgi:hypothetical protein